MPHFVTFCHNLACIRMSRLSVGEPTPCLTRGHPVNRRESHTRVPVVRLHSATHEPSPRARATLSARAQNRAKCLIWNVKVVSLIR